MIGKRSGWLARGAVLVIAFVLAVAAFRMGVGTDAREGVERADLLTHLYYAAGLFVLGGLDLGLPAGGPAAGRAMLWVAYFLAPLVTTSAVAESVLRLLRPAWLQRRGLRNHVVIIGGGRLGMTFLHILRERDPRARVVVVDRDSLHHNAPVAIDRYRARFIPGDVRDETTLDSVEIDRARAVALLTNDDLVNLEVAWRIADRGDVPVIAHVTDLGLRRTVEHVGPAERVHLFNTHKIAAERLYREHLQAHFASTTPEDIVVIAGFGRFGQTILEHLQREAKREIERVVVVDMDAERQARLFRSQVPGFEDCQLVTIEGDLDEPETWKAVDRAIADAQVRPVYVIATDAEQANLRTAVSRRSLDPGAKIFVRTAFESGFSDRIARELDFTVIPIDRLVRDAMRERQERWLNLR